MTIMIIVFSVMKIISVLFSFLKQVTLICRRDMIEKQEKFYVDTEKVTEANSHENISGDLAIVDEKGRVVFWCYIKRQNVCKFNTALTGLDAKKMEMGLDIKMVKIN